MVVLQKAARVDEDGGSADLTQKVYEEGADVEDVRSHFGSSPLPSGGGRARALLSLPPGASCPFRAARWRQGAARACGGPATSANRTSSPWGAWWRGALPGAVCGQRVGCPPWPQGGSCYSADAGVMGGPRARGEAGPAAQGRAATGSGRCAAPEDCCLACSGPPCSRFRAGFRRCDCCRCCAPPHGRPCPFRRQRRRPRRRQRRHQY